jgi:hypothetical protein
VRKCMHQHPISEFVGLVRFSEGLKRVGDGQDL